MRQRAHLRETSQTERRKLGGTVRGVVEEVIGMTARTKNRKETYSKEWNSKPAQT